MLPVIVLCSAGSLLWFPQGDIYLGKKTELGVKPMSRCLDAPHLAEGEGLNSPDRDPPGASLKV